MRILLYFLCAAGLIAQQPAETAKPEQTAPPAEQAQEAIAPATERNVTFVVDAGGRFIHTMKGDSNTYRSVVNLGEGPKLFGAELMATDPKSRLFDRVSLSANNWGGEPYNTLRLDLEKSRWWRVAGDYRNIAYFNFLPSFANPALGQTVFPNNSQSDPVFLNQRSFDIQRRYANVELEVLPSRTFTPYFIYSRDSGDGRGITPFVSNGNEYPVATTLDDGTHYYRGGVRIQCRFAHLTLEQGRSSFQDNQRVFTADRNLGNRLTPLFGQQLFLSNLLQSYAVDGDNNFSKAVITAAPAGWVNLYGQFLYSQPDTEVRYTDDARGLFFLTATRFYNGLNSNLSSEAKMPRSSGSFGAELRPLGRLRIVESWMTERFHNAASALLSERFLFSSSPEELQNLFSTQRLVVNYNRQQADVFFDLNSKVTIRGGHRYTWGDATVPAASFHPTQTPGFGRIRMHTGLAGVSLRPYSKLSASVDYEGSPGDENYFRTSLHDYNLLRARARWQPHNDWVVSLNFRYLDNRNPATGIDYELESRSTTAAVQWLPKGGNRISVLGEYTRSAVRSDILYLVPLGLFPERSLYRDNAHTATGVIDVHLPGSARAPRISLGGSLFQSSGSRPTRYYQPLGRVQLPLHRGVEAYGEWRWYGLSQPFFLFESFRSHQFLAGLRLSM
jgi:hypothetical protein